MSLKMGLTMGLKAGLQMGLVSSFGAGPILAGVTQDATSLRYRPATNGEWTKILTNSGLANPSFLWNCQESTGSLADSIGTCTLSGTNSPGYQTTVAGWTTKAVSWVDGAATRFDNTTVPPNGNASSLAMLGYFYVSSVGGNRFMAAMTDTAVHVAVDSSGHEAISANLFQAGATTVTDGVVRPYLVVYNRAASTCKLYTLTETVDGGFATMAGQHTVLGAYPTLATPNGGVLYAAQWTGAAAEMTDTQAQALISLVWNGH